jgi:hypothetical protein
MTQCFAGPCEQVTKSSGTQPAEWRQSRWLNHDPTEVQFAMPAEELHYYWCAPCGTAEGQSRLRRGKPRATAGSHSCRAPPTPTSHTAGWIALAWNSGEEFCSRYLNLRTTAAPALAFWTWESRATADLALDRTLLSDFTSGGSAGSRWTAAEPRLLPNPAIVGMW